MRKYFLLAVLGYLAAYHPAHAQLEKGTGYVGATIGISGTNSSITNEPGSKSSVGGTTVTPSLSAGKFVKDNFLLGVNLATAINLQTLKQGEQKYRNNSMSYYVSPFIRNYKTIGSQSKWAVFLTTSAEIGLYRYISESVNTTTKTSGFSTGLNVKPGIAYWITPRFSLESDINLLSFEAGYSSYEKSNSFYLRSGVTSRLDSYFSVRAAWYIQKR